MKPLNLGSYVDWTRLLQQLGQSTVSKTLPATVICPICQAGRMSIFQHPVSGGQWHYCNGCGQKGDMLQLAAKAWNLSIQSAVIKCINLGFPIPKADPHTVDEYIWHFHTVPARADELWAQARSGGLLAGGRKTANLMFWRVNPAVSWNDRGVSQVLGSISALEAQKILAGGELPKKGRIFKGKDWHDALVLPYYDLPGRICGFQFIGKHGSNDGRVFVSSDHASAASYREGGLAGHPNTFTESGSVIAFRGYYFYLRLQCRQLESRDLPAPMVSWRDCPDNPTVHAWQSLRASKVIFWDRTVDLALLRHAIRVNGWIVDPGLENDAAVANFLSNLQPSELFGQCEQRAVPWPQALAGFFANRSDAEVEDFLLQLRASGEDVGQVIRRCSSVFAKRITRILNRTRANQSVVLDSRTVEERADGWYFRKGDRDEQISNVILRLDALIWYPQSGSSQYQGRIIYRGKEIPFEASSDVVENETPKWLQSELLKAQAGVLQYSPSWAKKLIAVANRFHEPKMVTGLETVGWDNDRNAFVLPNYAIQLGGTIEPHKHFRNEVYRTPGDLPRPGSVNPTAVMAAMKSTESTRAFWSIFTAIAANIVAPAVNRSMTGIALLGYSSQRIAAAAASATDCSTYKSDDLKISSAMVPHRWPRYVSPRTITRRRYIEMHYGGGDLIEVDLPQAASLLFSNRFHVIEAVPEASFELSAALELSGVLPLYLKYLAETRFNDVRDGGPFLTQVRRSLARCIHETFGCQTHAIHGLDERWRNTWEQDQLDHAPFLAKLLYMLFSDGHAVLVPLKNDIPKAVWEGKKGVYLSKVLLRDCLLECDGVQLEPDNVTKQLAAAGCLIGEVTMHGRSCWLINREWLSSQLHQVRNKKVGLVRIADGT